MSEQFEHKSDVRYRARLLAVGLTVLALLMLGSCCWAKYFVVGVAINNGLGTPKPLFVSAGTVCSGIAFASPVYSALILALAPFSLIKRMSIAVVWLLLVMIAMWYGKQAWGVQASNPAMFADRVVLALPLTTLGLCLPFCWLRLSRGWRIEFPNAQLEYPHRQIESGKFGIKTMFAATLLVALCLFSYQFSRPQSSFALMIAMLATTVLGAALALHISFFMRTRFYLLTFFVTGVGWFVALRLLFYLLGVAPRANWAVGIATTTMLLTPLAGLVVVRLCGGALLRKTSTKIDSKIVRPIAAD